MNFRGRKRENLPLAALPSVEPRAASGQQGVGGWVVIRLRQRTSRGGCIAAHTSRFEQVPALPYQVFPADVFSAELRVPF